MIISFSNLGGGGGGGYTLPTATASRLGGVKIGSGVTVTADGTISVEGGGSDANAQHRFTAATESDMESLTGVSEGDICVIPPVEEDNPADLFYEALNNGDTVFNSLSYSINRGSGDITLTFKNNPYFDQSQVTTALYANFEFEDGNGVQWGMDVETEWENIQNQLMYYKDGDPEDSQWKEASVDYSITATRFSVQSASSSQDNNGAYLFQPSAHTEFAYYIEATVHTSIEGATYQYNRGMWVKLATQSDINNLYSYIGGVESQLNNKLNWYDTWINDPSEMTYDDAWCHTHINNEDKGAYLVSGWWDDTQQVQVYVQKRVAEITTSEDVMRIQKLTQAQYDALVSGGTVDSQTLYVIIPSNI